MNKKNISFINQNKLRFFSFIFIFLILIIFLLTINKIVKALDKDEYDSYSGMQEEEGTEATLQQILSDFLGEDKPEVEVPEEVEEEEPEEEVPPETITVEEDSKVDITTPTIVNVEDGDNTHHILAKEGSLEFNDGELFLSAGMILVTEDLKIVTSTEDGTQIEFVDGNVEVTGHISVDYENRPDKIILIGEDSSVELQTDEDEKFEFNNPDDTKLIVNIGSFHDSESEEFKGKNCISYQEMGIDTSGEEWNRLKVDGNAIITKTVTKSEDGKETEERIYKIKFKNGRATLNRDLSKLEGTDFSEKTVINYNSGDITLFIETSEKRAEEMDKDRVDIVKGSTNVRFYNEFYDNKGVQLAISSGAIFGKSIQGQICQEGVCPPPLDWTQTKTE